MATAIVAVGCYYGYTASRRPGRGRPGDRQVDDPEHGARAPDRDDGLPGLLGGQSEGADRGLSDGRGCRATVSRDRQVTEAERRPKGRTSRRTAQRGRRTFGRACARAPPRRRSSPTTAPIRDHGREDTVEFIDVVKRFGRNTVLDGLNLGIPDGMITMILGPSGTGKSVCIKHMVGLLYPDEGDVLVHGQLGAGHDRRRAVRHAQEVRRAVPGRRAVRLDEPLRQRRLPAAPAHGEVGGRDPRRSSRRRLREVGLGGAEEKMPNELSGGMRKRAGFARALVLDPEIVLFDEPDSGLDPVRTALLCDLIREIHEENGGTYVVITHDIASARRHARLHGDPVARQDRRGRHARGAVRVREPVRAPVPRRRLGGTVGHGITGAEPVPPQRNFRRPRDPAVVCPEQA